MAYNQPSHFFPHSGLIRKLGNLKATRSETCKVFSVGSKSPVDGVSEWQNIFLFIYGLGPGHLKINNNINNNNNNTLGDSRRENNNILSLRVYFNIFNFKNIL